MSKAKIIVTLRGGVVQNVYSTIPDTDLTILDYDEENLYDITQIENEIKSKEFDRIY